MRAATRLAPLLLAAALPLAAAAEPALKLHVVPVAVKSYRLLAMSMDADGFIWTGSIHRVVHRYDPRTAAVETIKLPYDSSASSCICAGTKVYILGQSYPRLIIYDRATKQFRETAYPSPNPDVWYGTEAIDGRHLFLFDRGSVGLIRWDTQTDTGQAVPWPYPVGVPSLGRYEPRDKALWCYVWDFAGGQYKPVGLARFDPVADKFTGWYPFPAEGADLPEYADPAATFFVPHTLKGKLVPFDFKRLRWCRPLAVPRFGELFAFIGLAASYRDKLYFSLSTYNGTELGCDGKPYHFCNALLEFDPATKRFAFPTLEAKDAFYQVAYTLAAGGEFYATGSNIREADGRLNQARAGEVVFWQTRPPAPSP
ncbi:MAG TPA: hypothetical protein VGF55_23180 [Gemmataceae bacterium]|jgi:streptogramin lyase